MTKQSDNSKKKLKEENNENMTDIASRLDLNRINAVNQRAKLYDKPMNRPMNKDRGISELVDTEGNLNYSNVSSTNENLKEKDSRLYEQHRKEEIQKIEIIKSVYKEKKNKILGHINVILDELDEIDEIIEKWK